MSKWLKKFQVTPVIRTDSTDTVTTTSAMSVVNVDFLSNSEFTTSVLSVPTVGVFPENDIELLFHERAAIMEFDGGLPKQQAEYMASLYALQEFISKKYPNIYKQFKSVLEGKNHE